MYPRRALVVMLAGALLASASGCGRDGAKSPTTTSQASTTTSTAAPTTTTTVSPTAGTTLTDFFDAATRTDEQLRAAAALINAAGPPWSAVDYALIAAVRAADPARVAATIPAGLPHDLLGATMLVYSDLMSRSAAMTSFASERLYGTTQELTAELANGHEAAQRFATDLANARALAASRPAVTPAASDSRAAAELLLLLQEVDLSNTGCRGRGGQIMTALPKIVWKTSTTGTIGGVEFKAARAAHGWHVELNAC